jgi:hypothetical protein
MGTQAAKAVSVKSCICQRGTIAAIGVIAWFIFLVCTLFLYSEQRQPRQKADQIIGEQSRSRLSEKTQPGTGADQQNAPKGFPLLSNSQATNAIQAISALAVAFFTLALFVATLKLVGVAGNQAEIANRQAKILVDTSRPWVSVRAELLTPLELINKEVHCTVRFHLKNTGGAVATGIYVIADLIHWTNGLQANDIVAMQQKMCAPVYQDKITKPIQRGVTLFAGEETTMDRWFGHMRDHFPGIDTDNPAHPAMKPLVIGCVDYWFGFGDTDHHQTGFVFDLDWVNKESMKSGAKYAIPVDGSYDFTQLKLYTWPYGGWYAD